MSDPGLVDIEPGGENTQYESIREFTLSPAKQTGQLGGNAAHTESIKSSDISSTPTGDSRADTEEDNLAQKLGLGIEYPNQEELEFEASGDAEAAKTRRQQGYGPGSGVGA